MPELPTHIVACTDDLFALTLLTEGGVDHLLRRLISYGMPAVRALRLATYNAAYRLGRAGPWAGRRRSAGRPHRPVRSRSRPEWTTSTRSGVHVAHDGKMRVTCEEGFSVPPLHTVHIASLAPEDFVVRIASDRSLKPAACHGSA